MNDTLQLIIRQLALAVAGFLLHHGYITEGQTDKWVSGIIGVGTVAFTLVWGHLHQKTIKTTPTPANQATLANPIVTK
jgi:cytochrome b